MRWLITSIITAVLLFGLALPVYLAPNDLAACRKPTLAGLCTKADAIVAVSGGDTDARADEAIKLYKAGWADTIIFSGAAGDVLSPSNASEMQIRAVKEGVPTSAIIVDENARTTQENAANVTVILKTHGLKRVILVTSSYHERRATLEFRKAVGSKVQILSHPVLSDNQWSNWWWTTPVGWWLSISELIKIGAFYVGIG
jgi:uncharacterized SAM-binding protein YcdF (DUF218 family)